MNLTANDAQEMFQALKNLRSHMLAAYGTAERCGACAENTRKHGWGCAVHDELSEAESIIKRLERPAVAA